MDPNNHIFMYLLYTYANGLFACNIQMPNFSSVESVAFVMIFANDVENIHAASGNIDMITVGIYANQEYTTQYLYKPSSGIRGHDDCIL